MKTTIYIEKKKIYKKINNFLCIYFSLLVCGIFSVFGLNFMYSKNIPNVANVAQEIYIYNRITEVQV